MKHYMFDVPFQLVQNNINKLKLKAPIWLDLTCMKTELKRTNVKIGKNSL